MVFTLEPVHERYRLLTDKPLGELKQAICCTSPFRLSDDALAKMNRYSSERAQRAAKAAARRPRAAALGHATWAFLRSYFVRSAAFSTARPVSRLPHISRKTFWRYLKIAEHARRIAIQGPIRIVT